MQNTCRRGERTDSLSGSFIIFQPENGQRYTTDDMLAAWIAFITMKRSSRPCPAMLDLGSGLGTVPMILLWAIPGMQAVGIEVSRQRLMLAAKSRAANGLSSRLLLISGDLRRVRLKKKFFFVTSSPPYYEKHEGPLSSCPDRASVRFELQGCIEDYFQAAADHLEDGGFFTTVYPFQHGQRVFDAAEKHGFHLVRQVQVIPRESRQPLFSLFAFAKNHQGHGAVETLTIRGTDQRFTDAYKNIRRDLGFPEKER